MKAQVGEGQCLVDMALMLTGSLEGVWALAERNGLGLTESLVQGDELTWEQEDVEDQRVVDRYASEDIIPATSATDSDVSELLRAVVARRRLAYEDLEMDYAGEQSTRASVHSTEFTTAFA